MDSDSDSSPPPSPASSASSVGDYPPPPSDDVPSLGPEALAHAEGSVTRGTVVVSTDMSRPRERPISAAVEIAKIRALFENNLRTRSTRPRGPTHGGDLGISVRDVARRFQHKGGAGEAGSPGASGAAVPTGNRVDPTSKADGDEQGQMEENTASDDQTAVTTSPSEINAEEEPKGKAETANETPADTETNDAGLKDKEPKRAGQEAEKETAARPAPPDSPPPSPNRGQADDKSHTGDKGVNGSESGPCHYHHCQGGKGGEEASENASRIAALEAQVMALTDLLEGEIARNDDNARRLASVQRQVFSGPGYSFGRRGRTSLGDADIDPVPDRYQQPRADERSQSGVSRGGSAMTSSSSSSSTTSSSTSSSIDAESSRDAKSSQGNNNSVISNGISNNGASASIIECGADGVLTSSPGATPSDDMCGFLFKEGRVRKTWKRRWFVLRGKHLAYYKTKPTGSGDSPKGTISLSTCALETATLGSDEAGSKGSRSGKKGVDCLALITQGRKLYFHGETPEETAAWVAAIRTGISRAAYVKKCKMVGEPADPRVMAFFAAPRCIAFVMGPGSSRAEPHGSSGGQAASYSLDALVALQQPIGAHSYLQVLDASGCGLTDVEIGVLCGGLSGNATVRTLALGSNDVGPAGASEIARMLTANETIDTLLLDRNRIGDEGLSHIAGVLPQHRALTSLSLCGNAIGDAGIHALANALCKRDRFHGTPRLPSLLLSDNMLTDESCGALAAVLMVNSSIRAVRLERNAIGDAGVEKLCEGLRGNRSVEELELRGNRGVTSRGCECLVRLLRDNRTLTALDVGDNVLQGSGLAAIRALWGTGLIGSKQ